MVDSPANVGRCRSDAGMHAEPALSSCCTARCDYIITNPFKAPLEPHTDWCAFVQLRRQHMLRPLENRLKIYVVS